jgi:hypothetical protein
MLGDDGRETYDVYYAWDTDSVFKQIKDGVADRPKQPPINRADRPVLDRVLSRESSDREAVENAFANGDKETRAALLEESRGSGRRRERRSPPTRGLQPRHGLGEGVP